MRDNIHPILFLDDWPAPPNSDGRTCQADEDHIGPGMNNMRKWRLQTLLAVNPWGIPVMAFKEAYERMFPGKQFDPKDHGYENICSMVYDLPDIFAVQDPDDVTALMFPDYPHDRILHDARLGHEFVVQPKHCQLGIGYLGDPSGGARSAQQQRKVDHDHDDALSSAIDGQQQLAAGRWNSSAVQDNSDTAAAADPKQNSTATNGLKTIDPDILISYAWLSRDTDFPPDVVLAGEQYSELILPLTSANIPGTRGVHQAIIVGVATPDSFYINVKTGDRQRFESLTRDIYQFFMQLTVSNIDSYNLPDEFIYPGFPCLVYSKESKCWERCVIVSRSTRTNRVLVEYVDYGGTINVNKIYLYLMPRRFLDLPKQAILCSLMGLRPVKSGDKWSPSISCRMRFFSQPRYWLDVMLVEPKIGITNGNGLDGGVSAVAASGDKSAATTIAAYNLATANDSACSTASAETSESSPTAVSAPTSDIQTSGQHYGGLSARSTQDEDKCKRKKRVLQRKLDYEAVICDRQDDHGCLDIFLDEILVMEEFASFDTSRSEEFNSLKKSFREALSVLPRPENPFLKARNMFWPTEKLTGNLTDDRSSVGIN